MLHRSVFVAILFLSASLAASQEWTFVKLKEGISLYTRKEAGQDLKAYKGTMDISSTVEKVAALIRDVNDNDWWNDNISEIRVLSNNDPLHFQYYMVYNLGWPLSDRDLVIDSHVTTDPVTKKYEIRSRSIPAAVPEKEGVVRIRDYWQLWTVQQLGKGIVRVTLEGFANPAGDIPGWIYNAALLDSPFKILKGVRLRVGATPVR